MPRFQGKKLTNLRCAVQDDLLYESLTVWEVLYYAAMLRLPRTMSTAAKKERVATVIKALGIEACRDTIIGECPEASHTFLLILICMNIHWPSKLARIVDVTRLMHRWVHEKRHQWWGAETSKHRP